MSLGGPKSVAIRRTIKVSVRSDLLEAAREAGLTLSTILERVLVKELASARRDKWRNENREAIAAYNDHVRRYGTFSELLRSVGNRRESRDSNV